ncbi:MAG: helix-turn-helix domain containing protein [Candidatus Manganitrophus sp.]|nr:MAG: helix-turn-helix domain containing protein [Candidatus Manganitrophus sp.]
MPSKHQTSRSDKAERRRKELLEVSLRLFSENGYDATSIRDIAREAGITEGLIYHYFQGKKDLLKAIVQGSVCDGVVFEQIDQVESLPIEEAVLKIGAHLLENLRNRKEIFTLMLAEARLFEKDKDYFIPKLIYENNMLRFGAFLKKRMERGRSVKWSRFCWPASSADRCRLFSFPTHHPTYYHYSITSPSPSSGHRCRSKA